jgi:hypothetical protein
VRAALLSLVLVAFSCGRRPTRDSGFVAPPPGAHETTPVDQTVSVPPCAIPSFDPAASRPLPFIPEAQSPLLTSRHIFVVEIVAVHAGPWTETAGSEARALGIDARLLLTLKGTLDLADGATFHADVRQRRIGSAHMDWMGVWAEEPAVDEWDGMPKLGKCLVVASRVADNAPSSLLQALEYDGLWPLDAVADVALAREAEGLAPSRASDAGGDDPAGARRIAELLERKRATAGRWFTHYAMARLWTPLATTYFAAPRADAGGAGGGDSATALAVVGAMERLVTADDTSSNLRMEAVAKLAMLAEGIAQPDNGAVEPPPPRSAPVGALLRDIVGTLLAAVRAHTAHAEDGYVVYLCSAVFRADDVPLFPSREVVPDAAARADGARVLRGVAGDRARRLVAWLEAA